MDVPKMFRSASAPGVRGRGRAMPGEGVRERRISRCPKCGDCVLTSNDGTLERCHGTGACLERGEYLTAKGARALEELTKRRTEPTMEDV